MAFALTTLYIVITLLSPQQFGQGFANIHPMTYLGTLTALASLFHCVSYTTKPILLLQGRLMAAFIGIIAFSEIANASFSGAINSVQIILPSAAVFFFIAVNVNTIQKLKTIALVVGVTCAAMASEALLGYYKGVGGDLFVVVQDGDIHRLRAAGFLNDPNDFSQILLIAVPLLFISWNSTRYLLRAIVIGIPCCGLVWAIYLTHSRGGLVGLGVVVLIAFERKIGKVPAMIIAGTMTAGLVWLDFTGGRGLTIADGSDRLELWSTGLQLFKSAPLWGIGFGGFSDFSDHTAHNSFVLCLAELGLLGSTTLVALMSTTLTGLTHMLSDSGEIEDVSSNSSESSTDQSNESDRYYQSEGSTAQSVLQLELPATVMRLALVSFIVTSFFLSRSYTTTMYMILGLSAAAIQLHPSARSFKGNIHWGKKALVIEVILIIVIYALVRLRS